MILALGGCNFSDFSKTATVSRQGVPACDPSSQLAPDAGSQDDLIAAWSFDDPSGSPPWLDSVEQRQLLLTSSSSVSIPAATRLNGSGNALFLDGQSYAMADNADGSLTPERTGFTVSAWISIRLDDFNAGDVGAGRIWPIVSTIGGAGTCGGYQLDLRSVPGVDGPVLAFTYQTATAGDAGDSCSNVLEIPLRKPSWAWGNGRWHHVVATYTNLGNDQAAQAGLALYLDGTRLEKDTPESSIYDGWVTYTEHAFYVGSNGRSNQSNGSNFKGHLDEVAVFGRALPDNEIAALNLTQSTRPGPSNCRWSSLDQWDFAVASSASWAPDSTENAAKLRVNDLDWGAGFLSARLLPERDLSIFDTAYLTADVPPGASSATHMFQFSISSGDDSCTWMLAANGPDRYVINLRQPSFCVASSCSFKPNQVEWARVSSEWAHANGSSTITVSRLEFDTTQAPPVESLPLGGAIGPNGWCWRPQAFDPNTLASWVTAGPPSPSEVQVDLSGGNSTTARLVADFGDKLLDLSGCTFVEIDADVPDLGPSALFDFALLDANGAEKNWKFTSNKNPISIDFKNTNPSYESTGDPVFANVPPFLPGQVRLAGIDKPYLYVASPAVTIAIRAVRFLDANRKQGCDVPATR